MVTAKKARPWGCLVSSFARVLNVTDDALMEEIGHDGSTELWYDVDEPGNHRGFHVQELIRVCRSRGLAVTPVEMLPSLRHPSNSELFRLIYSEPDGIQGFHDTIHHSRGVMVGTGMRLPHAVSYDRGLVSDPDVSGTYGYSLMVSMMNNFYPNTAYVVEAVNV